MLFGGNVGFLNRFISISELWRVRHSELIVTPVAFSLRNIGMPPDSRPPCGMNGNFRDLICHPDTTNRTKRRCLFVRQRGNDMKEGRRGSEQHDVSRPSKDDVIPSEVVPGDD